MATSTAAGDWLAELERRYDGPIPEPLRQMARLGPGRNPGLIEAEGEAAFFARLVRDQLLALRRRRGDSVLLGDLALYRRRRQWWRREAARLRDTGPAPVCDLRRSAGDAP